MRDLLQQRSCNQFTFFDRRLAPGIHGWIGYEPPDVFAYVHIQGAFFYFFATAVIVFTSSRPSPLQVPVRASQSSPLQE